MPADVAKVLSDYLAEADGKRPFALPDKSGKMLHEDMAEARTVWLQDSDSPEECYERWGSDFLQARDSAGLMLDFHSFRHGYVTEICKANVSPRVMMELARHSDPRLTMKLYSRLEVVDMAKALNSLPKLAGEAENEAEGVALKATGSTNTTEGAERFATRFAKSCSSSRSKLDHAGLKARKADIQETLANKGKACTIKGKEAPARVAQLDRASVYGTEGYRFESCRACFSKSP